MRRDQSKVSIYPKLLGRYMLGNAMQFHEQLLHARNNRDIQRYLSDESDLVLFSKLDATRERWNTLKGA